MAISKSKTLKYFEIFPASGSDTNTNAGNPHLQVFYKLTITDTSDDDLPIVKTQASMVYRYSDEDNQTATDVTGHDQLVQDVCGEIWS